MFLKYAHNVYSQNGEDGIIAEIFSRIEGHLNKEKWCVEFGAWDGNHLSNTFNLVKNGWCAVYIEADEVKYSDLLSTCKRYDKIIPVNAKVSPDENDINCLDTLLDNVGLSFDYDLLSIDIDSFDLAIWKSTKLRPKVVIIEINSSVMPGILQWHDGKKLFGNSFSATILVAKEKGYTLVCHTGNLIFIRDDLVDDLGVDLGSLENPERMFLSDWIIEDSFWNTLKKTIKNMLPTKLKEIFRKYRK